MKPEPKEIAAIAAIASFLLGVTLYVASVAAIAIALSLSISQGVP